ncbi:MAG: glycosyltransferase family 9 protein [Parvibaculum sp.]
MVANDRNLPVCRLAPESVLVYACEEVIGDGILKLRFAQEIKRRFPKAKLTWLAGTGKTVYSGLFREVAARYIYEIIEDAGIGNKTHQLVTMWTPLKGRHFDLIIDTQRLVARTVICKRIKHDVFLSGAADGLFSDVRRPNGIADSISFVDRLIDFLDLVSPKPETAADPVFKLSGEWHDLAARMLPPGPHYVGIAPGAGDPRKVWPLDRFIEIAERQIEKGRVPVFLLGPDEKDLVPVVRSRVPQALLPEWDRSDDQRHLKGPLLVMALAARMNAALANDSGVGHMLAVGGAPLVSLFTHHDPEKYRADARVIHIIHSQRDYGSDDGNDIPSADVLQAIDQMIASEVPLRT